MLRKWANCLLQAFWQRRQNGLKPHRPWFWSIFWKTFPNRRYTEIQRLTGYDCSWGSPKCNLYMVKTTCFMCFFVLSDVFFCPNSSRIIQNLTCLVERLNVPRWQTWHGMLADIPCLTPRIGLFCRISLQWTKWHNAQQTDKSLSFCHFTPPYIMHFVYKHEGIYAQESLAND